MNTATTLTLAEFFNSKPYTPLAWRRLGNIFFVSKVPCYPCSTSTSSRQIALLKYSFLAWIFPGIPLLGISSLSVQSSKKIFDYLIHICFWAVWDGYSLVPLHFPLDHVVAFLDILFSGIISHHFPAMQFAFPAIFYRPHDCISPA